MASQCHLNNFSMRIVSIDYYLSPPIPDLDVCYSNFHGGDVLEVPVIRIYGSTLSGQKTCLHIHRVLPYLYIPCSDVLRTPQDGYAYTQLISHHMEKALKLKSSTGSKKQHVQSCSLVRAKRFYGYYSTEELFVKIYLYHPHEVACAAALLMSGAVLNRSFQPYESHFPYLLQFLVDYNLYGMGLIQLSKVKFRHPLPVNLNSRVVHHINMYNILCRHDTEKSPVGSESFQADLCSEACQDLTVWLSSTIPSSWIWPSATEHGCSLDQGMRLMRRQTTCELEADTSVDEILNQQCKMYTSLSQTRSEVKMVQSLVPIWEEYERTGVHEIVTSPDPTKPPPEAVLRKFTSGLGFETALLDLCKAVQNSSSFKVSQCEDEKFMKSIRSISDSLLEEFTNPDNSHGEAMKFLKENKISSSSQQISLSEGGGDGKSLGQMDECHGLSPVVQKILSADMLETSNTKVADFEALGLLRWLASSQAMEDLNTDDELIHEAILSPLLPSKAIEKILEKAHLDYESESQKECQDILDSIGSKESAQCSTDDGHLPKETITQVDGSFHDPFAPVQMANLSDVHLKDEVCGASLHSVLQDSGEVGVKNNRNKQLWGPLPLSRKQKVHGDSDSSLNTDETCFDEARSVINARSSADKQLDYLTNMADMEAECCVSKEGKMLTGFSVRDLMRRKRSNQFGPSESVSHVKKKVVSTKHWAEETCPGLVHQALQDVGVSNMSCELTHVRSSIASLSAHRSAAQERERGAANSRSRALSKLSVVKPYYNDFPRYAKLPLPSCPEKKLQNAVIFDHFGFQDDLRHTDRHGNSAESKDILELSQLAEQSIQGLKNSIPDQQYCTKSSSVVKSFEPKVVSDSTCFKPLEHDVQSCETDSLILGSVLKSNEDAAVDEKFKEASKVSIRSSSPPAGCASFINDNYNVKRDKEVHVDRGGARGMPSGNNTETNGMFDVSELQVENCIISEGDMKISRFAPETRLHTNELMREKETKLVEITFRVKPPAANCRDWKSEDAFLSPFVQHCDFVVDLGNCDEKRGF